MERVSKLGNVNTTSETWFEEFLNSHGHEDWTHEEPIPGKRTTPDYRVEFSGSSFFFEVKEFDANPPQPGVTGFFDPYAPIREKVNTAANQFKSYKEFSCSVVLANPNSAFVMLDPQIILSAMLGDFSYRIAVNPCRPSSLPPPIEPMFGKKGKMVQYRESRPFRPQNTTISSIIVLGSFPISEKRFRIEKDRLESELGRRLFVEEWVDLHNEFESIKNPFRVVVYENPYARMPLHPKLFTGPYDERYSCLEDRIGKTFQGEGIAEFDDSKNPQ